MQTTKRTLSEITTLFAKTLQDAASAKVEVVSRAQYLWTFCGAAEDVQRAVKYVETNKLMRLERPIDHDEELAESFAFLDDRVERG